MAGFDVTPEDLVSPVMPFANLPDTHKSRWGDELTAEKMKECIWLRPEAVVQIEFLEWTAGDRLRHSKFVRLREDRDARTVVKECEGTEPGKPMRMESEVLPSILQPQYILKDCRFCSLLTPLTSALSRMSNQINPRRHDLSLSRDDVFPPQPDWTLGPMRRQR